MRDVTHNLYLLNGALLSFFDVNKPVGVSSINIYDITSIISVNPPFLI
jgi:hypothetical protein